MRTRVLVVFIISLLISCGDPTYLLSQTAKTGTVQGTVLGADTKASLPAATVVIVGTNNGAVCDLEGKFIIRNVPIGRQEIKVTYVGYTPEVKRVDIRGDQTTELEVVLEPHAIETKQVLITAQAQGQMQAMNEQIHSVAIKNVVSPERLQENPDANAAEAIGRLPGISLIRSGGEGVDIVVNGMGPQYTTVTLNGLELPSTSGGSRSTSISGISEYLLQSVEVYKTITPDMDGNSVAGSINLELATAPDSAHYNVFGEGGYNNMNEYWGNYRFAGDLSKRLLDKRLGVILNFDVESVNRSTQTLNAAYKVTSNTTGGLGYEPVYLNDAGLNDISQINKRQGGTLVLDYTFSPASRLVLSSFLSSENTPNLTVNKDFNPGGNAVTYNVSQSDGTNILFSSSLRGEHALPWFDLDYGVAFSQTHNYSPNQRGWSYIFNPAFDTKYVNQTTELLPPNEIVGLSNDNGADSTLKKTDLVWIQYISDELLQEDLTSYLDFKVPFNFGNSISGFIKTGAKFKQTDRTRNYMMGYQTAFNNPSFSQYAVSEFDWASRVNNELTAGGLFSGNVSNFLGGEYAFGWYPNTGRLNNLWDWWNNFSNDLMAQGQAAVIAKVGSVDDIGFRADDYNSSYNDQNLRERYFGTYLMSELDLGSVVNFVPGVRYEKVTDDLNGYFVIQQLQILGLNVPTTPEYAVHNDEFWLPMMNLKVEPTDWLNAILSYTNTLSRPDYSELSPSTYIDNLMGIATPVYITGNPYLKPELWTNYDLRLTFYSNQIGMFDIDGFYKKVENKIWTFTHIRVPGDPSVPGFKNTDLVQVTETMNHQDPGYVRGLGFEWQTSFWYLPQPLNLFSLNINYSIIRSQIQYPTSRTYTTYVIDSTTGRPKATVHNVDSSVTDPLIDQPNDIGNISLGFNYRGFGVWLSFEYTGPLLNGWSYQRELIPYKNRFYRLDLQAVQKLPIEGMEILFDLANINNIQEGSRIVGSQPTYLESYGWTSDLGLRYRF